MKKNIIVILVCIVALAVLGAVIWSQTSHSSKPPPLSFDTITYNFGRIRSGSTVHHDFELRNQTNRPRVIDSVTSNCACTVPGKIPQEIAPHSSVTLPVDVKAKGSGPWETRVVVAYNDESWTTALLDGDCVLQVPPFVLFGGVVQGQGAEQRFSVHPFGDGPIHVKSVKCDGQDFEASVAPSTSTTAPADPEIIVRLLPSAAPGDVSSIAHIETDDSGDPVKNVELHATVVATRKIP